MLASDVLRAAVQAAMAVVLLTGQAHVWELGLAAAINGAAQSFFGPAATGLAPETVPAEQLQQANALLGSPGGFFSVGGPAAAGVLVAVFGPGLVFAIDAATSVVSVVSLALLRLPPRDRAERGSFHAAGRLPARPSPARTSRRTRCGTPSLSAKPYRPEARRFSGLIASCLTDIRHSVSHVTAGPGPRSFLLAALFVLT